MGLGVEVSRRVAGVSTTMTDLTCGLAWLTATQEASADGGAVADVVSVGAVERETGLFGGGLESAGRW